VLLVLISGRLAVCAENSASKLPVVMANLSPALAR
jgi:hypothetical protein